MIPTTSATTTRPKGGWSLILRSTPCVQQSTLKISRSKDGRHRRGETAHPWADPKHLQLDDAVNESVVAAFTDRLVVQHVLDAAVHSASEFADILALWQQVGAVSREVRFTSGLVSACALLFLDVKMVLRERHSCARQSSVISRSKADNGNR